MTDIHREIQAPHGSAGQAQRHDELAKRLDAVHPLAAATLLAFKQDAEIEMDTIEEPIQGPLVTDIETLLASEDVALLTQELSLRAEHSLKLLGDLRDYDPRGYDLSHQKYIVRGKAGPEVGNLLGAVLVVRRSLNGVGAWPPASVVLVGGLTEKYPNTYWREVPPNPTVHALHLRPYVNCKGNPEWMNNLGYCDMDVLGQIPNPYFSQDTYNNPFDRVTGHSRAYDAQLGEPSYQMPASLNPADIIVTNPRSIIDHLVKNATEALRIKDRISQITTQGSVVD